MNQETPPGHRPALNHYDPSQLIYQVVETMVDRVYLRHGVDVGPGDVVLDVGANVGVVSVFLLAECNAGLVHSFEPVEPLFELLSENIRPYPNGTAHQMALSAAPGTARIAYYPGAAAMSGFYTDPSSDRAFVKSCLDNQDVPVEAAERVLSGFDEQLIFEVRVETVSSVLRTQQLDSIDLLKIDVEKAELDVINGIERRDWSRIRQIVVEVHDIAGRLSAVGRLLQDLGFRIVVDQDGPMKHTDLYLVYGVR